MCFSHSYPNYIFYSPQVFGHVGGYLFHDPERAGRVIEACVCLHNCAKVAKLKILKDFPSKDGFRVCRTAVVQPKQVGVKPKLKFANLRKDFIDTYFKPKANAV
jgi:hypothetical protein